jgi:hypothetical protein
MKLLLIDDYVINYKALINARKEGVEYLLFNSSSDTYERILKMMREMHTQYTDIAFIQHGYKGRQGLEFLEQEGVMSINEGEPYPSFDKFKNFLVSLKSEFGVERFDLLACSLYVGDKIKAIVEYLEKETGIDLRASSNFTGNSEEGGDWIMESDNVDIRENYFTDAISSFKGVLYEYAGSAHYGKNKLVKDFNGNVVFFHKYPDPNATGAPVNPYYDASGNQVKFPPCSISVWGNTAQSQYLFNNGTSYGYISPPTNISDFVAIYSNYGAFAGLRANGTVVCWGLEVHGAALEYGVDGGVYSVGFVASDKWSPMPANLNNVKHIYSTERAFAALKYDGTVTVWGNYAYGGRDTYISESLVGNSYYGKPSSMQNVESIYSTERVFIALTTDGIAYSWGQYNYGSTLYGAFNTTETNVKAVYTNRYAFCLLKADGTLKTFGDPQYGGGRIVNTHTNYKCIYSTERAFAALKFNGTVEVWGDAEYGGSTSSGNVGEANEYTGMSSDLLNSSLANIIEIHSTDRAFLAINSNRQKFYVWGYLLYGGYNATRDKKFYSININGSSVGTLYSPPPDYSGNKKIVSVYSNERQFAFLLISGDTVSKDYDAFGGFNFDGNTTFSSLAQSITKTIAFTSNGKMFTSFFGTKNDIALLTTNNELYCRYNFPEGTSIDEMFYYSIKSVQTHNDGIIAIKKDGTLLPLGNNIQNTPQNTHNFITVQSTPTLFTGLRLNPYAIFKSGTLMTTPTGTKSVESIVVGDILSTPTSQTKVKYVYSFEINTSSSSTYKLYTYPNDNQIYLLSSALIKLNKYSYESITSEKYNSSLITADQTNTYYCIIGESFNTTLMANGKELITYNASLNVKPDSVFGIYIQKLKYKDFLTS